ncbi:MAG: helix-turn-helix domain-containing protein [Candidatus Tyrphobacter sp.]
MRRDRVSAVQLAAELGCTPRTVSRWVNGHAMPLAVYIPALEARFEIPVANLLAEVKIKEQDKCLA